MTPLPSILICLAHPDDEVLGPGGALAHYSAAGHRVHLVCATRGEEGEIADPALATAATLAQVREAELRCAAAALGIAQVTFLGYRDSGMAGTSPNQRPDAFVNAPAAPVQAQLVAIIRQERPAIMLTFEPHGGYGHPDHIAIHQHAVAALSAAADAAYRPDLGPAWQTGRLFYPLLPPSFFDELRQRMLAHGLDVSFFDDIADRRHGTWPADTAEVCLDVSHVIDQKWAAFHCHQTQFGGDNLFRRLPEGEMKPLLHKEYFALAYPPGAAGTPLPDLFAPLPAKA